MQRYNRTPDTNVIATDARLLVEQTLYAPYGGAPSLNGGDDLPGALFVSTNPADKRLYFKAEVGGAFIACATLADILKPAKSYPITILPNNTLITINWDTAKIAAHGTEPFDIQLYEVQPDGSMQKSTALLTVNAAKTVYSFYVGENSNLNFLYKII